MYLFELVFLFSWDKYLEVELLGHMVLLLLIFEELFSIVAVSIYILTNSAQGFTFLHNLTNTCYFL